MYSNAKVQGHPDSDIFTRHLCSPVKVQNRLSVSIAILPSQHSLISILRGKPGKFQGDRPRLEDREARQSEPCEELWCERRRTILGSAKRLARPCLSLPCCTAFAAPAKAFHLLHHCSWQFQRPTAAASPSARAACHGFPASHTIRVFLPTCTPATAPMSTGRWHRSMTVPKTIK